MELLETREGDHLIESNKGVLDLSVRKKKKHFREQGNLSTENNQGTKREILRGSRERVTLSFQLSLYPSRPSKLKFIPL